MPTPRTSKAIAAQAAEALAKYRTQTGAANALGIPRGTLQSRLEAHARYLAEEGRAAAQPPASPPLTVPEPPPQAARDLEAEVRRVLQKGDRTLREISEALRITEGTALDICRGLQQRGHNVFQHGEHFAIERTPLPLQRDDALHTFTSDADGRYRFGFVTDNHLCSKYAREDVLNDLYDQFAAEGITRVYNAGNWIDGEKSFNRFDLHIHGMTPQVEYFARKYPQRQGITTYFIAGNDHEGWYAKDHGVDIGRYAEQVAEGLGRNDLRYIGYMEAFIDLINARTGATAKMMVVHPGGGSAYAISYSPQKLIESLEGGEKPAVCLVGHYHKMDCFNYRNVWILQGGTTEDQTPFMRQKKLQAHVGGIIVTLRQDERGSIVRCLPDMIRYFDRGYYQNQFNPAGPLGARA